MNVPVCKTEYALSFAAWELRLYLDTHPNDEKALAAYKQLCAAEGSACTYACNTPQGRMQNQPMNGVKTCGEKTWTWINGPWPWEYEANVNGGKC